MQPGEDPSSYRRSGQRRHVDVREGVRAGELEREQRVVDPEVDDSLDNPSAGRDATWGRSDNELGGFFDAEAVTRGQSDDLPVRLDCVSPLITGTEPGGKRAHQNRGMDMPCHVHSTVGLATKREQAAMRT